ncbi:hypothetical protein GIB67_013659 [Kingdonia uniflora]|uniref:RNase H type-1 domain-containing protein n=1 Tax=Kingdonia uniflora TaxID=39325 RepID=A0A7J7NPX2_9MAGN|nr:hypothetical protein GIB67_013659 [Kingdonia uniflora]
METLEIETPIKKHEITEEDEDEVSPIKQVRVTVPNTDDPSFSIIAQVATLPIGHFLAKVLHMTKFWIPGFGSREFSLNPGPFNKKEHVLISIFANVSSSSGYVFSIVRASPTEKVIGYGCAGLVRKYIVDTGHMWWPGTMAQVSLFQEILERYRASNKGKEDIHTRLMKKYKDIPDWWFYLLLLTSVSVSLALCYFLNDQVQMPWWGLILACCLALMFTLPVSVITATTNQTPGLNIITEYLMGVILPGRPIANVCFKTYGYISMAQANMFLSDFKLGHYMKIPQRSMFLIQLIGTVIAGTVNIAAAWWLLTSIPPICNDDLLPPNSPWTCPSDSVFFDASVLWGLAGPKRMFGSLGNYPALNWSLLQAQWAQLWSNRCYAASNKYKLQFLAFCWIRLQFLQLQISKTVVAERVSIVEILVDELYPIEITSEYNWKPIKCNNCRIFGHTTTTCPVLAYLPPTKSKLKSQVIKKIRILKEMTKYGHLFVGESSKTKANAVDKDGWEKPKVKNTAKPKATIQDHHIPEHTQGFNALKDLGDTEEVNGHDHKANKDIEGGKEDKDEDINPASEEQINSKFENDKHRVDDEKTRGSTTPSSTGHADFKDIVKTVWGSVVSGSPMYCLVQKLKLLKQALVTWSRDVYGNLKGKVIKAKQVLERSQIKLQLNPFDHLDDLMAFMKGDPSSAYALKKNLESFRKYTGLSTNIQKRQIFYAGMEVYERDEFANFFGKDQDKCKWTYIAVDTDGVLDESKGGIAALFRTKNGTVIGVVAGECQPISILVHKLQAIVLGLNHAKKEGHKKLQLRSDNEKAITMLKNGITPPWEVKGTVRNIYALIDELEYCDQLLSKFYYFKDWIFPSQQRLDCPAPHHFKLQSFFQPIGVPFHR